MDTVIRNMNFKPLLEDLEYHRLDAPEKNSTINMRVWDEVRVERLRSDAVKVILKRNIQPEPTCILSLMASLGVEVLIDAHAYDALEDGVEYFKNSNISRVLASTIATVIADVTMHSPIGPMITMPVLQLPQ